MSGATMMLMAASSGAPGAINQSLPSGASNVGSAATYSLLANGTYSTSTPASGNWVTPADASVALHYEVRVDVTAGTMAGGSAATGAWLSLDTNRGWSSTSCTFNLQIRDKWSGIIRYSDTGLQLVQTA